MKKIYTNTKARFLVYHKQVSTKDKAPYVVFLHGLMSDMNGQKAIATEKFCIEKGYNFIKFDNFGHGSSSGKFTDQTMSDWLIGINLVIQELADAPILLLGSSMGAWLALIATNLHPEKIIGVITLAAAVDFTEELMWNKFTKQEKEIIKKCGIYEVRGNNADCMELYPVSYKLIEDGRNHLMIHEKSEEKIDISVSVHLIHGMQDTDVPYDISLRVAAKLKSERVVIKLIKDANHRLSRKEDLNIMFSSIEELINYKV